MKNFIYYTPTKIFFGKGEEDNIGKIINSYGFKKILLHYGKESIKTSGLYDKTIKLLKASKIDYVELGGVEPNPKLSLVLEGIKIAIENKVELVLAVGGGSVIDSAKAIANGYYEDNPWLFNLKIKTPEKALPVGVILTLAAAGSEMSQSCVITNDFTKEKRGFNSPTNRPLFSILNPELSYSVNKFQTGCGVVDIMMHTMERYYSVDHDTDLTDNISLGLLKATLDAGKKVIIDPYDYESRATLMWASSLSHNDLTGVGRTSMMPVHQIEHELSGMFDNIAHGAGLSVLFPAWAKYVYEEDLERFYRFAKEVMNTEEKQSKKETAYQGIIDLESYFKSLGMPTKLSELNVDESSFKDLSFNFTFKGKRIINDIKTIGYDECMDILNIAK